MPASAGVSFPLKHPAFLGQALHLSLPLPKAFRQYTLSDTSYRVYGLVRDVYNLGVDRPGGRDVPRQEPSAGLRGQPRRTLPPAHRPAAGPKERRGGNRVDVFVNLKLRARATARSSPSRR